MSRRLDGCRRRSGANRGHRGVLPIRTKQPKPGGLSRSRIPARRPPELPAQDSIDRPGRNRGSRGFDLPQRLPRQRRPYAGARGAWFDRIFKVYMRITESAAILFVYIALAIAAQAGAFLLRYDFVIPGARLPELLVGIPVLIAAKGFVFLALRLYRSWWQMHGIADLVQLLP